LISFIINTFILLIFLSISITYTETVDNIPYIGLGIYTISSIILFTINFNKEKKYLFLILFILNISVIFLTQYNLGKISSESLKINSFCIKDKHFEFKLSDGKTIESKDFASFDSGLNQYINKLSNSNAYVSIKKYNNTYITQSIYISNYPNIYKNNVYFMNNYIENIIKNEGK